MVEACDKLPVSDAKWLVFDPGDSENNVLAAFQRKFRVLPRHVCSYQRNIWAGPVPEAHRELE